MRVLVVGGSGTIGRAVVDILRPHHDVIVAARRTGAVPVDITSADSIQALFRTIGRVDAVVSCAGSGAYKPLEQLTDADFAFSLSNKLMGQVNLVRLGLEHVNDNGSFTLTSGVLSREPTPGSAALSLVNAGLEAFARAAALELPRGIRINVVSPPWVSETLAAMKRDPSAGLPAAVVARSYAASIDGERTGETIDSRSFR